MAEEGIEVHTNELLDTVSDTTLNWKDIAGKLRLTGTRRAMNISNDVTNTRKISSQVVNLIIATQTNKYNCFNIDDARGVNIPNNKIDEVVINKYELYIIFPF